MIRVLFICHGNICRSPMAEFLFRDMLIKKRLSQIFFVASAATSREEIGNRIYPPAKEKLSSLGIDCSEKTARQVTKKDYQDFDYLLVMEAYNTKNLMGILGDDPKKKVYRLLDFSPRPRDIADPWYTGNFDITHTDIMEGLEAFLHFTLKKKTC
ncbi:low molecular weight protein-tyrosine-phosphatase [Anaerotignum sp.]|uniref:low molecular weight protein-tyrosine-phosphatase n=1 Tax=Anaerotignum sp. TaxID=2039241 RepID=UPI0027151DEF|nr:low molecular weight protein-tyrosine-phosphatase [Anaerotignum sp.]